MTDCGRKACPIEEAIIRTCRERARPVLLTAGAAVLGVLPIAFGLNINFVHRDITIGAPSTQWWIQLSTSIVFGLTFATILTLIVTPAQLAMIALGPREIFVRILAGILDPVIGLVPDLLRSVAGWGWGWGWTTAHTIAEFVITVIVWPFALLFSRRRGSRERSGMPPAVKQPGSGGVGAARRAAAARRPATAP